MMSAPDFEKLDQLAALVGLSREEFVKLAAKAGGTMDAIAEEAERVELPPPIVYPNVKFPRYKFREYPKLVYRGAIQDVEEAITKLVPGDNGGFVQKPFIRSIPDQFVQTTKEVANATDEALALASGWFHTRGEAIDAARAAKATQRPIIEKPAPARRGRPPKGTPAGSIPIAIEPEGDEGGDDPNPMAENAA